MLRSPFPAAAIEEVIRYSRAQKGAGSERPIEAVDAARLRGSTGVGAGTGAGAGAGAGAGTDGKGPKGHSAGIVTTDARTERRLRREFIATPGVKRCPQCCLGVTHYRHDGCHAVECDSCDHAFCFVCRRDDECECPHDCLVEEGGPGDCGCIADPAADD